jgi:hypothetical protein
MSGAQRLFDRPVEVGSAKTEVCGCNKKQIGITKAAIITPRKTK